jgi:hypothetical protein
MRKRDSQAISGEKAELEVAMKFLERGWTAQKVTPDYGEDLMVRIFTNGKSTPYMFFVQVKGLEKHSLNKGRNQFDYTIEEDHYNSWMSFWQPMFLVVWSHSEKKGRWEWVQQPRKLPKECVTEAQTEPTVIPRKVRQVLALPFELNDDDLQVMENMVRRHYQKSVVEEVIREDIFEMLEEDFGVSVSIDGDVGLYQSPENVVLVAGSESYERLHAVLKETRAVKERAASDDDRSALATRIMGRFVNKHIERSLGEYQSLWPKYQKVVMAEFINALVEMKDAENQREVIE